MTTDALLQYIAVAIIVVTVIVVAIRYIYRLVKSNDATKCSACPLSDCCNKKNTLDKHNCNERKAS